MPHDFGLLTPEERIERGARQVIHDLMYGPCDDPNCPHPVGQLPGEPSTPVLRLAPTDHADDGMALFTKQVHGSYPIEQETPAEHIRNAVQLLRALPIGWSDLKAIETRLNAALVALKEGR